MRRWILDPAALRTHAVMPAVLSTGPAGAREADALVQYLRSLAPEPTPA